MVSLQDSHPRSAAGRQGSESSLELLFNVAQPFCTGMRDHTTFGPSLASGTVGPGPSGPDLPLDGWIWLAAGGLACTAGVAFYAAERLTYGHCMWHLFVLAGTARHFVAV